MDKASNQEDGGDCLYLALPACLLAPVHLEEWVAETCLWAGRVDAWHGKVACRGLVFAEVTYGSK